jgi:hypothetical protein
MDSESQKQLNKALGTAVENDKVTKVKALLKEGAEVNHHSSLFSSNRYDPRGNLKPYVSIILTMHGQECAKSKPYAHGVASRPERLAA